MPQVQVLSLRCVLHSTMCAARDVLRYILHGARIRDPIPIGALMSMKTNDGIHMSLRLHPESICNPAQLQKHSDKLLLLPSANRKKFGSDVQRVCVTVLRM